MISLVEADGANSTGVSRAGEHPLMNAVRISEIRRAVVDDRPYSGALSRPVAKANNDLTLCGEGVGVILDPVMRPMREHLAGFAGQDQTSFSCFWSLVLVGFQ